MNNKSVRYYKPNIGDLRGKIGRSILETIRNTPKPDKTILLKDAAEFEKNYRLEETRNVSDRTEN